MTVNEKQQSPKTMYGSMFLNTLQIRNALELSQRLLNGNNRKYWVCGWKQDAVLDGCEILSICDRLMAGIDHVMRVPISDALGH